MRGGGATTIGNLYNPLWCGLNVRIGARVGARAFEPTKATERPVRSVL